MAPRNGSKLNFRLSDVMRAALGMAMVDGGFVIAVQVITFLLGYFGINIQVSENQTIVGVSRGAFLISIIGVLNLSVIIYRMAGLARGIKYSPFICYSVALKRWPYLILLYVFGSLIVVRVGEQLLHILNKINPGVDYNKLLMFSLFLLIPYGILACIYVIDQERNPIQALMATWNAIKTRISARLLLNISMLYALPFSLSDLTMHTKIAPYMGLFNTVWFLFCHILIVVIYAGITAANNTDVSEKTTKVLLA